MKLIFGMFLGGLIVRQSPTVAGFFDYMVIKLIEWFPAVGTVLDNA
jgi:hypothetical protein